MKKILSVILLLSINSCASDISGFDDINLVDNQISSLSVNSKNTEAIEKFKSEASKFGAKLTDEQLRIISTQVNIKTSGKFAARPALNLSSEQNLDTHFKKHYKEFSGINNKEEYLERAIKFLNNNSSTSKRYFDTQSFSKAYQSNVIKYDSKTFELSAMRADGDITTYYTSKKLSSNRFVEVPENFIFN